MMGVYGPIIDASLVSVLVMIDHEPLGVVS